MVLCALMAGALGACGAAVKPVPAAQETGPLTVAVGIVPQAAFVEAVAGGRVRVTAIVPPGNSPETYQPTMAQMRMLSDAAVYFTLNLPTERASILPRLSSLNEDIVVVDLQAAVAAVYPLLDPAHGHGDDEDGHAETADPHVWLSPRRVIIMVQTIADSLSALDEDGRGVYQKNAARYIDELTALDAELSQTLAPLENRTFIIYHAAYAYFADDYGLEMVAVENEGKKASAADLAAVITLARQRGIKTVFYQRELDVNQARTIAAEIGGVAMAVEPLSRDYTGALRDLAKALAEAGI